MSEEIIDTTEPLFSEAALAEITRRRDQAQADSQRLQGLIERTQQQLAQMIQQSAYLEGQVKALSDLLQPEGGPQKLIPGENTGEVSRNGKVKCGSKTKTAGVGVRTAGGEKVPD